MWHANTVNFCNNELKQQILLGGLLESRILLQPNLSKANFTVLNKKCMKWERNQSLFEKEFMNFSADFISQKFCLTQMFTQIHSFMLVCICMLVYFELTMILHDFLHFSHPQTMSALMNKKIHQYFNFVFLFTWPVKCRNTVLRVLMSYRANEWDKALPLLFCCRECCRC